MCVRLRSDPYFNAGFLCKSCLFLSLLSVYVGGSWNVASIVSILILHELMNWASFMDGSTWDGHLVFGILWGVHLPVLMADLGDADGLLLEAALKLVELMTCPWQILLAFMGGMDNYRCGLSNFAVLWPSSPLDLFNNTWQKIANPFGKQFSFCCQSSSCGFCLNKSHRCYWGS